MTSKDSDVLTVVLNRSKKLDQRLRSHLMELGVKFGLDHVILRHLTNHRFPQTESL